MSYNYNDNNEELIKEAGNTIFENIYKNCKTEIKNQIITNLLLKIQEKNEIISSLEKENKKLKDNFIYVLKRILSNKEDYNTNNNLSNALITNYYSTKSRPIESRNNMSYRIRQNNSKEKTKVYNSMINSKSKNKYKIDYNNNSSADDLSIGDNSDDNQNNNINERKAKKYLNNLYRNNFEPTDGIPYSNFINKNISLYEELFPKTSNKSYLYTDAGSITESPHKKRDYNSSSKRNKSTGIRRKILIEDFENGGTSKNNKNKNKNENRYGTEKISHNIDKRHKNNNRYNNFDNLKSKRNIRKIVDNESDKKNKNNYSYIKRSPYLLNKF